jgi:hypothetical protein
MNESMILPEKGQKAPKQDVTPAVRQAHGQGGKKKPSEIIQQYAMQQTGNQQQVNQIMNILAQMIQKKMSRLIQFGNTVLWATQKGRGVADVHIFSLDEPKTMAGHLQKAYQWFKAHGFRQVTSTISDEQQLGVMKLAGIPFTLKPTQVNIGGRMMPGQVMTVEIK